MAFHMHTTWIWTKRPNLPLAQDHIWLSRHHSDAGDWPKEQTDRDDAASDGLVTDDIDSYDVLTNSKETGRQKWMVGKLMMGKQMTLTRRDL